MDILRGKIFAIQCIYSQFVYLRTFSFWSKNRQNRAYDEENEIISATNSSSARKDWDIVKPLFTKF